MSVSNAKDYVARPFAEGQLVKSLEEVFNSLLESPYTVTGEQFTRHPDGVFERNRLQSLRDLEHITDLMDKSVNLSIQTGHGQEVVHLRLMGEGDHVHIGISCDGLPKLKSWEKTLAASLGLTDWHADILSEEQMAEVFREALAIEIPNIIRTHLTYPVPEFSNLVSDPELAVILQSRWTEADRALRVEALLSVVILLGSILEGVLFDMARTHLQIANQSIAAPRRQDKTLNLNDWKLTHLIDVAHERGWLKRDRRDFSNIIRDYRNLIHPRQQLSSGRIPDITTCKLLFEALNAAFHDIGRARSQLQERCDKEEPNDS